MSIDELLIGDVKEELENSYSAGIIFGIPDGLRGLEGRVYTLKINRLFYVCHLKPHNALFLLLEVTYESGLPEMYQLPVLHYNDDVNKLNEFEPEAIICRVILAKRKPCWWMRFTCRLYKKHIYKSGKNKNLIACIKAKSIFTSKVTLHSTWKNKPEFKSKSLTSRRFQYFHWL